ncbi:arylsulfatase [Streptomyces iconiensis]|uniref:Arylsulfatase n=1 Tax=Streptomyces iconiensis TaxID=1384038 RepID=A0ABT6ZZ69_9ACTN|nr:arylsulfatase [Streptomyces iconiensis]MDJ1134365.1 arylsulfatase [Streptomyces iconiensis]
MTGPAQPSPNVVLICVDQWRGDCLSAAGHPVVRTPYLDAFAARGTRFSSAYSATPTCVPARAALHTGLSQTGHGRVGYEDGVPWTYDTTLAGAFGDAGYQTKCVGKMHVHPERARLGFDDVELHDGYLHFSRDRTRDPRLYDDYLAWLSEQEGAGAAADYADHGLDCNSCVARPWDKAERLHPTNWATSRAIDFLYRRDPQAPFFLFLSYHRPHPPYDPPAWAFDQYLAAPPGEPPIGDLAEDYAPWRRDGLDDAFVGRMDPVTWHRARAGYYGHMAHLDQQINRFLQTLAEFGPGPGPEPGASAGAAGAARETVVAFVSDHGEMLGEHGLWRKGYPYEGSARVPLLLAGPGVPADTVCDTVAELRDVMPTLLDAAGVPVPEGLDGHSLLPAARGESPRVREWLHGEHVLLGQSLQWLTDGREKYVWMSGSGTEQLFDLAEDPGELTDLARDPAAAHRVERWRARLVSELSGRPEGFVARGALVPGRPVDPVLPHLRERARGQDAARER